ncbi:MAG TPA: hypothetical protein VMC02_13640 [Steroidobacteraceae bacterium]|nr:hypothetical protein [Steroidobacteraceae bacterium]
MNTTLAKHLIAPILCCAVVDSGGAAAQQASGPCTLLTVAQVSAAVGASVGAGVPIGTTGCSWTAPNVITTVSLWDASRWEQMKAPLPGYVKTPAGGLGDDAFFSVLGSKGGSASFTTLSIRKGRTAYVVKVYSSLHAASELMSMETTLGKEVLARL